MSNVSDMGSGIGVSDTGAAAPAKPKPKRRWRKLLLRGALVVAGGLGLAQLMYTLSGDEKWEYLDQERGVSVYEMKIPGRNVKKFMAVFRLKATLSQTVAFLSDDEHDDMGDAGFDAARLLQRESPQVRWTYWRMPLAKPMATRDYVVKHVFRQDPNTKEVLYNLTAKPYMIPEDKCCVRVLKMDNSWRLTPLGKDETEVHWIIDMNIGGWAPYFMVNKWFPWEMMNFGPSIQEILERKRYAEAKLDWIQNF